MPPRRKRPTTALTLSVLAALFLAAACKTVPDPEGVAASAPPDAGSGASAISTAETVTDPFGPGSRTDSLTETDLTGKELRSDSLADDPARVEGRLEVVYFEFDQATLGDDARASLDRNASFLREYPTLRLRIEGHCDERGTTEYNLALGDRRANTVKEYLTRVGVDTSRFLTISFGEERPADPGHGASALARNRRAEFHVE